MKHLKAIDGLRAWCAWWVVCQHTLQISGIAVLYNNPVVRFLTMGGLAVLVFVTISGFVITNMMVSRKEPFPRYLLRRFLRIYPLYIVAVTAALILRTGYFLTVVTSPWAAPSAAQHFLFEQENIGFHIALHIFLIHGAVPESALASSVSAILAPAWSLSLEWQFYLVAPALLFFVFRKGAASHVATCLLCITAMLGAYLYHPAENWIYPAFLPLTIGFFFLGIASRMAFEPIKRRWLVLPLLVVIINLMLYARAYAGGHLIVVAIPVALWLVAVLYCRRASIPGESGLPWRLVGAALAKPIPVALGLWSYSTYLLHVPVFVAALWLYRETGLPLTPHASFAVLVFAALALVPLSWLSYRFIEQKTMRASLRWIDAWLARRTQGRDRLMRRGDAT